MSKQILGLLLFLAAFATLLTIDVPAREYLFDPSTIGIWCSLVLASGIAAHGYRAVIAVFSACFGLTPPTIGEPLAVWTTLRVANYQAGVLLSVIGFLDGCYLLSVGEAGVELMGLYLAMAASPLVYALALDLVVIWPAVQRIRASTAT